MNIRYLVSFWRTIRIPGLWLFLRDWMPFLRMQFLYAAITSGLLPVLEKTASRQALIKTLRVQRPELLDALLDMGVALKELGCRNGTYFLKGKRSRMLARSANDALAAMVQASATYYSDAYRHLADRMRGAPLSDDLAIIGDTVARFSKIGEPILASFIHSLVPSSGPFTILDVGCGSGFVLKSAVRANQMASGTGIDRDAVVVNQARENMERWGLEDRFKIVQGDIRSHVENFQRKFDLITVFNLIYYISDDERPEFFKILHKLLSSGGRLALVNNFQSKGRDAAAANLNIVNCSLKNLTALPGLEDIQSLLRQCGFNTIKTTRFMPGSEFYGLTAQVQRQPV